MLDTRFVARNFRPGDAFRIVCQTAETDFLVEDAFPGASLGLKLRRSWLHHLAEDAEYLQMRCTWPG